ncbi:MAG: ATP-binding protein [Myxococcota bacterium]|nr:PAS domain-containing protein [Deltaproteobacteria bacterium]MDQ3336594.1 ATP-binding protein [Myxococcota bacterium]
MRDHNWGTTSLGPIESWPRTLVSYVSLILELPTPAIVFWGEDQTQIYNDGYSVIMGPRHPRFLGAPYRECWPDTYPLIYPWMRAVLDRGEVIRVDNTQIPVTRHGFEEEAYFTFTFNPLRDDDGRIAGIYQPVTEVTEAVLSHRRSETLRMMTSTGTGPGSLEDAMAALARNANDVAFVRVFAWDRERSTLALVAQSGDSADVFDDVARRVSDSGTPEKAPSGYALPLREARGEARAVVVFGTSARLHFNDGYREFFEAAAAHLASDLSTREQAEAIAELDRTSKESAQRERHRLYAALLNAPGPFCLLTGEELTIELINHACLRVWRRDERIIGTSLLSALPELRDQPFPTLLRDVLRTGEPVRQRDIVARLGPDEHGAYRDVHFDFSYEPLRGSSGSVESVIVFAVDVTHQVLAQREIERALDDARRASNAKDEFLAMLGHELRNPMAPIVTALDMMRLRQDRDVSREREVIERQTKQLIRLVDDLLDISRITRGTFVLTKRRVDLSEIISRAIETTAPLFSAKRHELRVDIRDELVIDADADRMHQVFSNVLTNAAKYTPAGGTIDVTARSEDGMAMVIVRDSGAGIAPEMLPRIFEMFVQDGQDIDRAQGGLGLGLAIVRAIVRRHGGDAYARSEGKGKGAEIELRVPLSTDQSAYAPDTERTRRIRLAEVSRRIMIVDDNVDAATLLAEAIRAMGHEVCVAHDGASALKLAGTFEPQIALLDIGLPVMSGYELATQLRAQQAPPPRLIAITGYGQASDRKQSKQAGFAVHLVKPVDIGQLASSIEQLTERPL